MCRKITLTISLLEDSSVLKTREILTKLQLISCYYLLKHEVKDRICDKLVLTLKKKTQRTKFKYFQGCDNFIRDSITWLDPNHGPYKDLIFCWSLFVFFTPRCKTVFFLIWICGSRHFNSYAVIVSAQKNNVTFANVSTLNMRNANTRISTKYM